MHTFLCTTSSGDVKWLADGFQRNPDLIRSTLKEKLGQDYADLFAEPVSGRDGDTIDWYAPRYGQVTRLENLPQMKQASVHDALDRMLGEVDTLAASYEASENRREAALGTALRNAMSIPGDHALWVVEYDGTLYPVMTEWGGEPEGAAAGGGVLKRKGSKLPRGGAIFASGPGLDSAANRHLGLIFWALWAIVILCFFLILALLVAPCAVTGAGLLGRCQQAAITTTDAAALNSLLLNEISQMKRDLADASRQCMAGLQGGQP